MKKWEIVLVVGAWVVLAAVAGGTLAACLMIDGEQWRGLVEIDRARWLSLVGPL